MIGMAVIGWLSLLTWSNIDPSLNRATGGAPSNLLGGTGASLADMLFQVLGLAAIALFLPAAAWGVSLIAGERIPNPRHRLAMWTLSAVFLASTMSILPSSPGWPLAHGLGGVIGDFGKSIFVAIPGLLDQRIAGIAGGAVAGFLGLWTLLRACGIGRQELRLMMHSQAGPGRGVIGFLGAGLAGAFYGASLLRGHIANALTRETAPRRGTVRAYWEPEDYERFNPPHEAQGSFNPRHAGYNIVRTDANVARPLSREPRSSRIVPPAYPVSHGRLEPYFDNLRFIPRQPPRPAALPAAFAPPAYPQAQPQAYPQPQPHQQPGYDRPSHAPYANENFEADPYAEAAEYDQDADYMNGSAYDEPPPAQTTAVYRGPRHAPTSPAMPERAMRPAAEAGAKPKHWDTGEFVLPPKKLLTPPPPRQNDPELSDSALGRRAEMLQSVLEDFRIKGQITGVHPGPVITLYEFEPARGTKSSRVIGLADDIARSMSAVSARVAVIPGRDAIGIELPNQNREIVFLRQLLESKDFSEGKGRLQLALGKTIGGDPVIVDLARMPHLLIAGTTGSGKSVAINTMILSLLYRLPPSECRFIMIDPKMLELSVYDGIPHLLTPVVTDPHQAIKALKWTVNEMNVRYERMCKLGVRNIMGFNQKVARARRTGEPLARTVQTGFDEESGGAIYERENIDPAPMPHIVVVIDEMADLMMVAGKDIEFAVQRLSQMARAAGIHLIMATQRPSVDVITGTIKANFPSRISFQVTSKIDSRTILGEIGAEQLLGAGDMLTMAAGGRIMRAHGPFVSDDEVESVVEYLRSQGEPDYMRDLLDDDEAGDDNFGGEPGARANSGDDVYNQAIEIVLRDQRPTTSYLQRRLGIGYNRAASLIERMEADGIISAPNRTGKREVLAGEQT
jgi:S-DNA-T family DNA segregation ATPase FtsK/SpoIIIE